MSTRAAYIARIDGGERLAMVRLLGPRSDQAWLVENIDAQPHLDRVMLDVDSAVTWLVDRLEGTGSRAIDLLCFDTEGQRCTWIESGTSDVRIARAALLSRADNAWNPTAGLSPSGESTDAYSFQVLGSESAENSTPKAGSSSARSVRTGVVTAGDALVRLMLDALDGQHVRVGRVITLPQAMAQAWDADSHSRTEARDDDLLGNTEQTALDHASTMLTATVLVDPSGRIVWTWSRAGDLLCFGTQAVAADLETDAVTLTQNVASRLTADWLAWSVQLGHTPDRVVVLGSDVLPSYSGAESNGSVRAAPLTIGQFGSSLAASWEGASCDVVPMDDPIGQTLDRIVVAMEHGLSSRALPSLAAFEQRPSRAHKSVRRWVSMTGIVAAIALAGLGARAQTRARTLFDAGLAHRADAITDANEVIEDLDKAFAKTDLESRIQKLAGSKVNTSIKQMPNMLTELNDIVWVVATYEDVKVQSFKFGRSIATVVLTVPDTSTAEELRATFVSRMMPTNVEWTGIIKRGPGELQTLTLSGLWATDGSST